MGKAARAIIIENGKLLVMHRNKYGSQYYTLVGGRLNDGETPEQAVVREVKEETGLDVTGGQLVFYEDHPEPYNEQYIYLCNVAPHQDVKLQEWSEEAMMNRLDVNTHKPLWISVNAFDKLPLRTPQLHAAIAHALKKGFPKQAIRL